MNTLHSQDKQSSLGTKYPAELHEADDDTRFDYELRNPFNGFWARIVPLVVAVVVIVAALVSAIF